jgi:hypothetical protein
MLPRLLRSCGESLSSPLWYQLQLLALDWATPLGPSNQASEGLGRINHRLLIRKPVATLQQFPRFTAINIDTALFIDALIVCTIPFTLRSLRYPRERLLIILELLTEDICNGLRVVRSRTCNVSLSVGLLGVLDGILQQLCYIAHVDHMRERGGRLSVWDTGEDFPYGMDGFTNG